jgi:hypothetical protein
MSVEKDRPGFSVPQEAARAVGRRVGRHVDHHQRPIELGRVMRLTNPMLVEMLDSHVVLEEDRDFKMSQFLRWWDMNYQLMKYDVLLLTRVPDETWVAFDVRSDRDVEAGIRPSRPPSPTNPNADMGPAEGSADITYTYDASTGLIKQNHHIVKKLEVYDHFGALIGYVPIYLDLP